MLTMLNRSLIAGGAMMAALQSLPAQAQTYECVNEQLRIDIASQPLEAALDQLSQQTRCPISIEADIAGLIGNDVSGTYTPEAALMELVAGTSLTGGSVRQGLMVSGIGEDMGEEPIAYDCQNDRIWIDVPRMDLAEALDSFSRQTLCPISVELDVSGLIADGVQGNYRPAEALQMMVEGVGLRANPVRQGLEIVEAR